VVLVKSKNTTQNLDIVLFSEYLCTDYLLFKRRRYVCLSRTTKDTHFGGSIMSERV